MLPGFRQHVDPERQTDIDYKRMGLLPRLRVFSFETKLFLNVLSFKEAWGVTAVRRRILPMGEISRGPRLHERTETEKAGEC